MTNLGTSLDPAKPDQVLTASFLLAFHGAVLMAQIAVVSLSPAAAHKPSETAHSCCPPVCPGSWPLSGMVCG